MKLEVWGEIRKTEGTIPGKFWLWVLLFSNEGILMNINISILKIYFVFNGGLFCLALNFLCIVKMHENQKANLASSLFEREEKLAPLISLFKRRNT